MNWDVVWQPSHVTEEGTVKTTNLGDGWDVGRIIVVLHLRVQPHMEICLLFIL